VKSCCLPILILVLGSCGMIASASDQKSSGQKPASPPPHISKETRQDLIRGFDSELVYIRTAFPMGTTGLTLKDGVVSPSGAELKQLISLWGPALKPGDEARISNVVIKGDRIRFEINGGPVKKQKWYQRISVGMGGAQVPVAPDDQDANPRGSYVDLVFDRYVPDLSPEKFKSLLRPALDFDAKSAVEAYLETVPPKVKEAIQNHRVLVGMNREMVVYSKGRPPKKLREKDGEIEYEEWIYGEPPQDVDFVRMVGDQVVRVETMKVDGSKTLRTEKEVDVESKPTIAKKSEEEQRPDNAPTLRRPGESSTEPGGPAGSRAPIHLPPPDPPPAPPSQPNYSMQA
jgi:hypothetical protein